MAAMTLARCSQSGRAHESANALYLFGVLNWNSVDAAWACPWHKSFQYLRERSDLLLLKTCKCDTAFMQYWMTAV
eukprot:1624056-Amphidinium_carterae.1